MTINQEKAVQNVLKQKAKGKVVLGKAMKEAGYSKAVQHNPKVVTESLGFKEAMAKYGLTEENFAAYLSEDLKSKPGERLGELRLMADTLNLTKQNVNLSVQKSDESMALIQGILDEQDEEQS